MVIEALIAEAVAYGGTFKKHVLGQKYKLHRYSNVNIFNNFGDSPKLYIYCRNDIAKYIKNKFFKHPETQAYVTSRKHLVAYNKADNVGLFFNPTTRSGAMMFRPHDRGLGFNLDRRKSANDPEHIQTKRQYRDSPAVTMQDMLIEYVSKIEHDEYMQKRIQSLIKARWLDHESYSDRPFQNIDSDSLIASYNAPSMLKIMQRGKANRKQALSDQNSAIISQNRARYEAEQRKASGAGKWISKIKTIFQRAAATVGSLSFAKRPKDAFQEQAQIDAPANDIAKESPPEDFTAKLEALQAKYER